MAVRIRMKKMGRRHRPFYRICVMDARTARGGKVLEEVGTYDTSLEDTDARAVLDQERVKYWLGVGAQPTEKVGVLIKKYGPEGSRLVEQTTALERLAQPKMVPEPGTPASLPKSDEPETPAEAPAAESTEEAAAPAEEAPAAEETPATEPAAEAPPAEEAPAEEEKPAEDA